MKWAVSQRPGGATDNAQYLSGQVCTGLSGGAPRQSAQRGPQRALLGCSTGLSSVHRIVWLMVGSNDRLLQVSWHGRAPDNEQCMSGVHQTVRYAHR
jgi:hypothetical protein